jgi:hypothetical protein
VSFTLRRTLTPTELLRKRALRLMTARNQEVGDLEEKLGKQLMEAIKVAA